MPDLDKAGRKYIAEIDPTEMACRMAEAMTGVSRAPGHTARQIVEQLPPYTQQWLADCVTVALEYMRECFNNANRLS